MKAILTPRTLRTPAELTALMREIRQEVATGLLRQVRPDPSPFATDRSLADLAEQGPWPDYLELRFDVAGTPVRYKLSVETYHGSGGTWGPESTGLGR